MKNLCNIKKLFLIFSISSVALAAVGTENNSRKYVKTNRSARPRYTSKISFVQDVESKQEFVIKNHPHPEEAIHETVCAEILETSGIKTNHVEILPAGHSSVREFASDITTVHSLVPGEEIEDIKDMQDFSIADGLGSWNIRAVLRTIIKYGCADLVAANTYLDDRDSYKGNNFFDKKTNQLYTIDKESAFYDLRLVPNNYNARSHKLSEYLSATQTHKILKTFDKEDLSLSEMGALEAVNNKLQEIMAEYPAEILQQKLIETAQKVHYKYASAKREHMQKYLQHNFDENCEVVMQLDRLTGPYEANKLFLDKFCPRLQKVLPQDYNPAFSPINS